MENFINLKPNNNQKYNSNQINDAFSRKTKDEKKFLKSLDNDKNKNKNKNKINDVIKTTNDVINTTINTTLKQIKNLLNYQNKEHFRSSSMSIIYITRRSLFIVAYILLFLIAIIMVYGLFYGLYYALYYAYCHYYKKNSDCSLNLHEKIISVFGKKQTDMSSPVT